MDARLWLSGEGGAPRSVALSGERTVVGRSPEADVQLEDEAISWNHLEIERRGDVLMATDLDSRNHALLGDPIEVGGRPGGSAPAPAPSGSPAPPRTPSPGSTSTTAKARSRASSPERHAGGSRGQ